MRQAVLELYLSVKIRSDEEIEHYEQQTFEKEKQELRNIDGFVLIDYIKQSIEMLMNMKMDENQANAQAENPKSKIKFENSPIVQKNQRRYKNIDEPEINIKQHPFTKPSATK